MGYWEDQALKVKYDYGIVGLSNSSGIIVFFCLNVPINFDHLRSNSYIRKALYFFSKATFLGHILNYLVPTYVFTYLAL